MEFIDKRNGGLVMCSYRTWCNNDRGYVVQCNGCNHIQVAFATLMLSLTKEEFFELIKTAECAYHKYKMYAFDDRKCIKIPTASKAVTMAFSLKELNDFICLLRMGSKGMPYGQLFIFNEK